MGETFFNREQLDLLCQSPVLFDALIAEEDAALVFVKTVTIDDPGVSAQRTSPGWPHHLPGELVIALTGQAGVIAMRRKGLIGDDWRGHGVRIHDARFSAAVLLGETFYTRVEIARTRRIGTSIHARYNFRMWKNGDGDREIETYRSRQDAIFFPAGNGPPQP